MIKLSFCLVRLPHLSLDEFQSYWREKHGPLVRERAGILRIRRYVQSHTIADDKVPWLRASRQAPPSFDGVAELWWDSMADFTHRSPDTIKAGAELLADEKTFIDLAKSPIFLSETHEFVSPSA